jgi:threonine synthase
MRYISTRGAWHDDPRPFRSILLEGLAPDGGLAVPQEYPRLSAADLARLRPLDYRGLAFEILSRFIDDIPPDDLRAIIAATYNREVFGSDEVTPLLTLEPGLHLLRVSNGPTLAFKDIALQLLGRLFDHVLRADRRTLNILGATSGDTGSSAEHALRGVPSVAVFMLSPNGRMSPFQQAQMYALQDANIHNLAVKGVFDDCQAVVKEVNADAAFKQRWHIGAVNSINWARVAAQVVYYFYGFFRATQSDRESVSFAVPSGNFGNIYAGYVARSMGLPIRTLVLATNENDVLDEFFRSGRYRPRKDVSATSSPSMDISRASNFERYIYDVVGRDPARLKLLWRQLETKGQFTLEPGDEFASGRSSHGDRLATIRSIYEKHRVIVDPHTADGVRVGLQHREPGVPLICLETALPVKFAETIREALGREPERPGEFLGLEDRPQRVRVIEPDVKILKRLIANGG